MRGSDKPLLVGLGQIVAQNILEALEENLEKIRTELGPDWPRFCQELAPFGEGFTGVADIDALEIAADTIWQVCRRYPVVAGLIRSYSTPDQHLRVEASGASHQSEMPIREIVQRFQSLLSSLAETDQTGNVKSRAGENSSQPKTRRL